MRHTQYRTFQICIKPGHRLFPYFEEACEHAKNLYNATNFYFRQMYTTFRQNKSLQPLQQEVLDTVHQHIGTMNERQQQAHALRVAREQQKPADQRREHRCKRFELPSEENPCVNYEFLDCLFKVMEQTDYRSLPVQSSQWVMKSVLSNWKAFFASQKDFQQYPHKYTGKPRIPRYSRAKVKEVQFTNQDCVIKDNKYLKFPKTKQRLNIGKLGQVDGTLRQVRVLPKYGQFVVELVLVCPLETKARNKERYLAIDLGINNLATIVTTTGSSPVLVKGKHIKSINQYYNKRKAHYMGILRQGKQPKEGMHSSQRLERLHRTRQRKIKDLFHKASYQIVQLAAQQNIGTLVIGYNKGWKQEATIGKRNNQSFCHIPHGQLVSMIQYKAAAQGMNVILTEEAYTSKASFLDQDPVPAYGKDAPEHFSGRRIHRGLYQSTIGCVNADVNGAANILRKVVPEASAYGIEGLGGTQSVNVSTPLVLPIR
jgi:putative transposase